MKILVTGGTGVVGAGLIPELLKNRHEVRLLSRGAEASAREYPYGVEPVKGDVSNPESFQGAAERCQAVIHIAGIVEERPPESTFENINVEGTRHVLREATRAGVKRFLYLSSLGAADGGSDYHLSKRKAELLTRDFPGEWVILRPGNVYGPGDEVISLLLKMVRTLPAVPLVGVGDQPFQPIWFEDLGRAVAVCLDHAGASCSVLELAGNEVTTMTHTLDLLNEITGRSPVRLGVPEWLAKVGTALAGPSVAKAAEKIGIPLPINDSKLKMLLEGNVIGSPQRNALTTILGISATPYQEGLRALVDSLPELAPSDGVGQLARKRFWADIAHSRLSHKELLRHFRDHISEIMPIEFAAEPGVPTEARQGNTLTGAIPGRGNFQVRVEEEGEDRFTLSTLEGHPLAGTVTFRAEPRGNDLRFLIETYVRPSNVVDWIALRLGGGLFQNGNWRKVVQRVVELSGGMAERGVENEEQALDDTEAQRVEQWAEALVRRRKRAELATRLSSS